jgi:hypothetical protein
VGDRLRKLRWNVIAPVGLLLAALFAVAWFDLRTGGEAEPPPLLGELGTPVRSTYIAIPPTQIVTTPTAKPRSTGSEVTGTPEERDGKRRTDMVRLIAAFAELKEKDGEFPSTGGNTQTLCVFKDADVGCKVRDILGEDPPSDPLGDPGDNGYFYRSDGEQMQIYAQLEGDIPAGQECQGEKPGLSSRENLICLGIP